MPPAGSRCRTIPGRARRCTLRAGWRRRRRPTRGSSSLGLVTTYEEPGWDETSAEAEAWLVETRAAIGAPALSAAVSVDGERVWAGVAGYADLAARKAATLETAFRIGSSSKALTSIAIGVV